MKIELVTPHVAPRRSGNAATAFRWAGMLRAMGHQVNVATEWDGAQTDMMIAIHAWRSASSIAAFRLRYPTRPLIVALGGTDVYEFLQSDPEPTLNSMRQADRLIGLHDLLHLDLPMEVRAKLVVIVQSARVSALPRKRAVRQFEICVIANCRTVKDPLRAAAAARLLPPASRVQVLHFGAADEPRWQAAVAEETRDNARYRWHGQVPAWQARQRLRRAHLLVVSSLAEGGANVVSEAMVAGCPMLASRIPGNIGLLGADHPALFEAGDTHALAELMHRAEQEPAFLAAIEAHENRLRDRFAPAHEQAALASLVADVTTGRD